MSKKKKNNNFNKEFEAGKLNNDSTPLESTDKELDNKKSYATLIENDKKNIPKKKHFIVRFFLMLLLVSCVGYFISCLFLESATSSIQVLVEGLFIVFFTIIFIILAFTSTRRKQGGILVATLLLFSYFVIQIGLSAGVIFFPSFKQVDNFIGKDLVSVVEWADANHILLEQDYEYSDMVDEYSIISQNIKPGTKLQNIKSIEIAVSEGPNPAKEIVIPSMVSWDSERVLNFVKNNHLTNVSVSFVQSDKAVDTVIEQNKNGNLPRNTELELVFSSGEELDYSEVKLIDLTKKSEFEAIFYLKQHHIKYEVKQEFSSKIKRSFVTKQSRKALDMVKIDEDLVTIYVSKGPKIKVIDFKDKSIADITNWAIKNKLKLEFVDRYDDSIKENKIIEANYHKGDIIEQGSTVQLVISRGKLTMPKFKSLREFREWADKYEIKYEEKYEFSNEVAAGEVIRYSYKTGDTIKNNDSIIVVISDGKKIEVPDLVGMKKADIISKLKKLGLNYNFVYKSSSSVSKDKAISQSIKASSKVSANTTITITLSNGKEEVNKRTEASNNKNNSSNNSSNNSNNSGSGNTNNQNKPSGCDTSKGASLNIQAGSSGAQTKSMITQMNPNHKFKFNMVNNCPNGDTSPGAVCTNLEGVWKSFCDTIVIDIVN